MIPTCMYIARFLVSNGLRFLALLLLFELRRQNYAYIFIDWLAPSQHQVRREYNPYPQTASSNAPLSRRVLT